MSMWIFDATVGMSISLLMPYFQEISKNEKILKINGLGFLKIIDPRGSIHFKNQLQFFRNRRWWPTWTTPFRLYISTSVMRDSSTGAFSMCARGFAKGLQTGCCDTLMGKSNEAWLWPWFFMLTERATVKPQVGKPDIPSANERNS